MRKLKILLLTCGLSVHLCSAASADWVPVESERDSQTEQWKYEQNGRYLTNQWKKRDGDWYYLDEDGITLSKTTRNIDGVDYTFTSSGQWTQHSKLQNRDDMRIYTNLDFNYSIEYMKDYFSTFSDALYLSWGAEHLSFYTNPGGYFVDIYHYPRSQFPNFSQGSANSILYYYTGSGDSRVIKNCAPVHVDGMTFEKKYVSSTSSSGYISVFTYTGENGSMVIIVSSFDMKMDDEKSSDIVAGIKRV